MSPLGRIFIAGLLVAFSAGCEESTSGADRVAVLNTGPSMSSTTTTGGGAGGGSGGGTGEPSTTDLTACLQCGAKSCSKEVDSCSEACTQTIGCLGACTDAACEDVCLKNVNEPLTKCLLTSCVASCGSLAKLAQEIARFGKASCTKFQQCAPSLLGYQHGDEATCEQRVLLHNLWFFSLPSVNITAQKMGACADAIQAQTCDTFFSRVGADACQLPGTAAVGQPCLAGVQCASGSCPGPAFACSTCSAALVEGAACKSASECPNGDFCAVGKCVKPAAKGQACSESKPCDQNFLACKAGICQALPATAGASCGSSVGFPDCDGRAGLVCNSATTGTCLRFTTVATGTSCGTSATELRACRAYGTCVSGLCRTGPAVGDACNESMGLHCSYPSLCINSKCVGLPSPTMCQAGAP